MSILTIRDRISLLHEPTDVLCTHSGLALAEAEPASRRNYSKLVQQQVGAVGHMHGNTMVSRVCTPVRVQAAAGLQ